MSALKPPTMKQKILDIQQEKIKERKIETSYNAIEDFERFFMDKNKGIQIVILVVVLIIIILIGLVLGCLAFHRMRLQKVKRSALTKTDNDFLSGENRTINPSGTIQAEVQSHLGTVIQPVEQQSAQIPEVFYDQINNTVGLKNYNKPLNPRRVLVNRDPASEDCYDDVESEHIYLDIIDNDEQIYEELNNGSKGGEAIYMNTLHSNDQIQSVNEGGYICMNKPVSTI